MQTLLILLSTLFLGYACSQIARRQGRNPAFWFIIGVLFGLIGLIVIALLPPPKLKEGAVKEKTAASAASLPMLKTVIDSHIGKLWYYLDTSKAQLGPMSLDALSRDWREGKVSEKTFVWNEEMTEWTPVLEVLKED